MVLWMLKEVLVTQLCPTLCDPMSIHGILQARILEWVAISFTRGSSPPRDQTWVSHIEGRLFYQLSHQGSLNPKDIVHSIYISQWPSMGQETCYCWGHRSAQEKTTRFHRGRDPRALRLCCSGSAGLPGPFTPLPAQLTPSLKVEALGAFVVPAPSPHEYIEKISREGEHINKELKERFALESRKDSRERMFSGDPLPWAKSWIITSYSLHTRVTPGFLRAGVMIWMGYMGVWFPWTSAFPCVFSFFLFFLKPVFILQWRLCLFIDLFLALFICLPALGPHCGAWAFSSWGERRLLSSCGAWASHCGGLSRWGSRVLEHRFSSCGA